MLKRAFRDSSPVMAGYIVLGIGFGILLKNAGYGLLWALLMSVFIYAGSMQYLAVSLISGGASLITCAVTTLLVNARHLFYGISMLERYRKTGKKKPYLIFALTDETYSLVCEDKKELTEAETHSYYLLVSFLDQIYWITGSCIGSILGSVLPISTAGIEFSLTALFVTVFVDQWLNTKDHRSACIGVAASVICLFIFGGKDFLIPSMILIAASLLMMGKLDDKKKAVKGGNANE